MFSAFLFPTRKLCSDFLPSAASVGIKIPPLLYSGFFLLPLVPLFAVLFVYLQQRSLFLPLQLCSLISFHVFLPILCLSSSIHVCCTYPCCAFLISFSLFVLKCKTLVPDMYLRYSTKVLGYIKTIIFQHFNTKTSSDNDSELYSFYVLSSCNPEVLLYFKMLKYVLAVLAMYNQNKCLQPGLPGSTHLDLTLESMS